MLIILAGDFQEFNFIFHDKELVEQENVNIQHQHSQSSSAAVSKVMSEIISWEILSKITSNLYPDEICRSLLLVHPEYMESLSSKVQWTSLELGWDYYSLRGAQLASPSALKFLRCEYLGEIKKKRELWGAWKKVIENRNLKELIIAQVECLQGVTLSPSLQLFGIASELDKIQAMSGPGSFQGVDVPNSVKTVIIDPGLFWSSNLTAIFPGLQHLAVVEAQFLEWGQFSTKDMAAIEKLTFISLPFDCVLPPYRFRNLTSLTVAFEPVNLKEDIESLLPMFSSCYLPKLTSLRLDVSVRKTSSLTCGSIKSQAVDEALNEIARACPDLKSFMTS